MEETLINGKGTILELHHDGLHDLHREDGPALTITFSDDCRVEYYFRYGKLHNSYGPAIKKYRPTGELWHEDYYLYGAKHRFDGPAVIGYGFDGNILFEDYYRWGRLHRTDGPAQIYYTDGKVSSEKYYIGGEEVLVNPTL